MIRARRVHLMLLMFILLLALSITIMASSTAAAESLSTLSEPLAQGGQKLDRSAWLSRLPIAVAAAFIVIAVDTIVVLKILIGRRRQRPPV